ncbi:MAG: flagellar export protein FliJ [Nitrospira sp.]|nr:flagellar export protein FliJ [Nitrospira sp.]
MHKKKILTKILALKGHQKQEIEIEFKKISDIVDYEKSKLEQLELDYSKMMDDFHKKSADGSMSIDGINSFHANFEYIGTQISNQQKVIARCNKELVDIKNLLLNAHKDEKVFEILTEKEVKKEKKEVADREQKDNDFFAISRKMYL